ncbi:beta-ketoacyl-[acyl-carrier-protein] synthase family protein [Amycolatopsis sp. NBC_01286]|uniref:beta-ketoacyl-[acyl-carrier-protein] synthase family protein n=1 Tax=Amycolatopsis sp. NBC_01286 TaxID=2903560 RepID=UPI002E0E0DF7|nr:beta-ketoacyl-[acyl-carrier-protein] synthase family protein [Amycolatopsis sp. NBC_01286]
MLTSDRRRAGTLCVTGAAWHTSLGAGLDEVWTGLLAGRSGLRVVPGANVLRSFVAGLLPGGPAPGSPRERHVELATATAEAALRDAGLRAEAADPVLVLGTSLGPHIDDADPGSLHDWVAEAGKRLGLSRPPVSLSTACSSGSDAIAVAGELLEAGYADVVVAGGVDLLTKGKRLGHSLLGTLSPSTHRAFDADRSGMLPGDGAGCVVLERLESARRRGARPLGFLRGWGSTNDAAGMTAPKPDGEAAARAVRRSVEAAGLSLADVAVVNAHGTATVLNDEAEATCLSGLFGDLPRPPVVFATKGALGHSLGATGVVEAITLLLALRDRTVPPVLGLTRPMPELRLPVARDVPHAVEGDFGISLTLGFGGFNTCVLFERGDDADA